MKKTALWSALCRAFSFILACAATIAAAKAGESAFVEFREVGQIAVPYGQPRAVCLAGGRAYVANGLGGLAIIDVGTAQPRVLGRSVTGNVGRDSIGREWIHEYRGMAAAVSVSGKFAFLLTLSKGYDISRPKVIRINVSDPAHPAPAGEYLMNGSSASDLAALDETHVCVLQAPGTLPNDEGPLVVVDFSEPGRERVVGTARLPKVPGAKPARPAGFEPGRIAISHGLAFICGTYGKKGAAGEGALHVISLANASAPEYVSTCVVGEAATGVAINPAATHAYVVSRGNLAVIDLGDILVPKVINTIVVPDGGARAVAIASKGGYLSTAKGLLTLDLTDPGKPAIGKPIELGFSPIALAGDGGRVALADASYGVGVIPLAPGGVGKPRWVTLAGHNLHLRGTSTGLVFSRGSAAAIYHPSATAPMLQLVANVGLDPAGELEYTRNISVAARRALWTANEQGASAGADERVATGQPAPAPAERGRFVANNFVYAAVDGMGLRIYDATDPAAPAAVGELSIPVDTRWRERLGPCAVFVDEKIAYLATGRDGLRLIDVSDVRKPVLLGHFYDSVIRRMAAVDVIVRDHRAYLADLDNGLYILDVSDPRRPAMLAHYHTANAHSVALAGNLAIVADGVYGMLAIDVSDSVRPRVVGSYHAPNIRFNGVAVAPPVGGLPTVCVADAGVLRMMTIAPTAQPPLPQEPIELVAHVKAPMGIPDALRISADGNTAFLAADEGWNFTAIDLRNPRALRALSVSATGGFCHGLALRGKYAYVTNNYEACTIFDVSDPANPALAGAVMGLTRCRAAAVDGDVLGLCTREGILLYDLADPVHPKLQGKCEGIGSEFALISHGGTRYLLGCGAEGLLVFDVSDLANTRRVGLVAAKGTVGLAVRGEFAFVTCRDGSRVKGNELLVISYSGGQPEVVGKVSSKELLGRLTALGNTLYIGGDQLTVVDVADPSKPTIVSHLAVAHHEGTYSGDIISDMAAFSREGHDMLAVADHYWGVRLYDAGDRGNLRELGEFAVSGGDFTGIQAAAPGRVYVSNNWGGIYIVDTSDPLHPSIVGGTRRLPGNRGNLQAQVNKGSSSGLVAGGLLYYQGNTDYVLRIADVHDPANPKLLSEFALPKEGRSGDDRRFGSAYPQLRGKYLYTPGFARIFDVGDPAKPALVGECHEVGFQNGTCILTDVAGKPYLIVCGTDALEVVDVHDPTRPALAGTLPGDYEGGFYFGRGVRAAGPIIYVLNRHQFNTVDISDPARPKRLASLELSGFCADVQVVDGLAYVAGYYDGLHLIDVHDPARPIPVDHFQQGVYWDDAAWDNIACYQSVDVAGDYIYVTEYYSGMLVLRRGVQQVRQAKPD
jgi:hypothetical protein